MYSSFCVPPPAGLNVAVDQLVQVDGLELDVLYPNSAVTPVAATPAPSVFTVPVLL